MKLQLAFRDLNHHEGEMNAVACVGLLEVPRKEICPEMIGTFFIEFSAPDKNGKIRPTEIINKNQYRIPHDVHYDTPVQYEADISSSITKSIWHRPTSDCRGQLFFRQTRVEPSRSGLIVMAIAGIVGVDPDVKIDQDSVLQYSGDEDEYPNRFQFEGRVGQDLKKEWGAPSMQSAMRGNSMMGFLRYPVWGFGEEPIMLPSVMHLEVTDKLDEYRLLDLKDDRTPAQQARYDELEPFIRMTGLNDKDPLFRKFKLGMLERGLMFPASAPETRTQNDLIEKASSEVLLEVMLEGAGGMSL